MIIPSEIVIYNPNAGSPPRLASNVYTAPIMFRLGSNGRLYIRRRTVPCDIMAIDTGRGTTGFPTVAPAYSIANCCATHRFRGIILCGDTGDTAILAEQLALISDVPVYTFCTSSGCIYITKPDSPIRPFAEQISVPTGNLPSAFLLRGSAYCVESTGCQKSCRVLTDDEFKAVYQKAQMVFFSRSHCMDYFILGNGERPRFVLFDSSRSLPEKVALCKNNGISTMIYDLNASRLLFGDRNHASSR